MAFFGWRMVGVAFGAHLVASALGFYALPRLMVPLAEEFAEGDRAGVALLTTAMSLPAIAIGPLIGRALTRYRLRTLMPLGALVFALGFLAASRATALWQLVAVYATAVPVAVATLSSVGANALVGNWFVRRRALALGVAQFGMSIGGAGMVFFVSWTLAQGDWRDTYLWLAGASALSALLFRLTLVDRPVDRGLAPDGDPPLPDADPAALPTLTFGEALRDPALWLVGLSAGVALTGTVGILQNAHALATDAGHGVPRADAAVAVIALGAALGKLVFGALGTKIGERPAFISALVAQAAMTAALPFSLASFPLLLVTGLCFGLVVGGVMPALAALIARLYGAAGFGPAMGYVTPMFVPFQMLGAPLAASVRDATGSYDAAIAGFAVAAGLSALMLSVLPLRLPPIEELEAEPVEGAA